MAVLRVDQMMRMLSQLMESQVYRPVDHYKHEEVSIRTAVALQALHTLTALVTGKGLCGPMTWRAVQPLV